ncbi:MAG: hypothetical protein KKC75_02030 [Nanoarchaeota archaeon]|nr:hypothetical protein [Nanoarchaeota archaeon]MBU1005037.1 hypothetical protein [Nanoarchaeota archaeon]MBU1945698.1 hypothetical protein [Nanoarchaeota archaeon]
MKEKTLLKTAIICAILGVFIIYLISENVVLDESSIGKIKEEQIGKDVKLKGVVNSVFNSEKATIITITQPEEIKVMLQGNISLSEGDYVEVIGEVDEYNGELEIIGNRVRIIG